MGNDKLAPNAVPLNMSASDLGVGGASSTSGWDFELKLAARTDGHAHCMGNDPKTYYFTHIISVETNIIIIAL